MSTKSDFLAWAKGYQYDTLPDPTIVDMFADIGTQKAWVVWQCAAAKYTADASKTACQLHDLQDKLRTPQYPNQ